MSKEDLVIQFLIRTIHNGELKVGDKLPSAMKLAQLCKVNKDTVNKAVGRLVERGLVERRGGAGGSVLVHTLQDYRGTIAYYCTLTSAGLYSSLMLRGAMRAAYSRGYALQFYDYCINDPERMECQMKASGVQGLLCSNGSNLFSNISIPLVNIGAGPLTGNYYYPDRAAGAAKLAELAIQKGHTGQIALLASDLNGHVINAIIQVYRSHGLTFTPEQFFSPLQMSPNIENLWNEIHHVLPHCTLVMAYSDELALKLIHHLETNQIRVPEDISVTGFGTMLECQRLRNITSVEEYPEHLGYRACQGLMDLIEGKRKTFQETYTPELNPGDTLEQATGHTVVPSASADDA